jgi:CHAD domain-containing protein
VRKLLCQTLEIRVAGHQEFCEEALAKFDLKDWRKLSKKLSGKSQFFPLESVVFQRLALSRLNQAAALNEFARKSRSRIAWHRLRIGLKHFRYILENFTPERGQPWIANLKRMQDLLGEVHDLDVLRREMWRHKKALDSVQLERWLELIEQRRKRRLADFVSGVAGNPPLWQVWREGFKSVPTLQLVPVAATVPAHSAS